ncbi:hypothetical protein ALI144C_45385 [Actinosynnema sp. ALI-1.44]|uniref:DUF3224 domain-containing protein n=1 Tax=Actinosynnema sp. ALI-1.44 TaxID=1933779 RepID=UPI00097BC940|nr:DUF3224 domain-containing protein [Actinosynnema sp. ALI-1.44]ONI73530.1 hypothetical protein ALI144C_45385 [Actinosynnema sp. ALI-1.44]
MNKFECTAWDESVYAGAEGGARIGDARMTFRYSGILDGESKSAGLLAYTTGNTGTSTGAEVFTGTIDGKAGTVILRTTTTFDEEKVSGTFEVVPGTGTGDLADAKGHGGYELAMGSMSTEYTFTS